MIALALISRLIVGGLLVFGGAAKLSAGPSYLANWLSAYVTLPRRLQTLVAAAFAGLELLVGTAFVLGAGGTDSAWAAAGLMGVVTLVSTVTLARGRKPSCGCAGEFSSSRLSWRLVGRNTTFVVATGLVAASGSIGPGLGQVEPQLALVVWAAATLAAYFAVDLVASRRFRLSRLVAPTLATRQFLKSGGAGIGDN